MKTMTYDKSLTCIAHQRIVDGHQWGGYRVQDILHNDVTVAHVTAFDNGNKTFEFDNAICYEKQLLLAITKLAESMTSGQFDKTEDEVRFGKLLDDLTEAAASLEVAIEKEGSDKEPRQEAKKRADKARAAVEAFYRDKRKV